MTVRRVSLHDQAVEPMRNKIEGQVLQSNIPRVASPESHGSAWIACSVSVLEETHGSGNLLRSTAQKVVRNLFFFGCVARLVR